MPRVSFRTELIGVVEQPLHVGDVEFFVVQLVEVRPDVGQVEICSVLLGSGIDPSPGARGVVEILLKRVRFP